MSKVPTPQPSQTVTSTSINQFQTLICSTPFAPVQGGSIKEYLDSSSNLLEGCLHVTKLITDGDPEDVDRTGYCLSFLIGAAKALVDSVSAELQRSDKP